MEQPFDLIRETEEALHTLKILAEARESEPQIATELCRLEARLRLLHELTPVFVQPA